MKSKTIFAVLGFLLLAGCQITPLDSVNRLGVERTLLNLALELEKFHSLFERYPMTSDCSSLMVDLKRAELGFFPNESDLIDPWGEPFVCTHSDDGKWFQIRSCGPDRVCSSKSGSETSMDDVGFTQGHWKGYLKSIDADLRLSAELKFLGDMGELVLSVDQQGAETSSWRLVVENLGGLVDVEGDLNWEGDVGSFWLQDGADVGPKTQIRHMFKRRPGEVSLLIWVVGINRFDRDLSNNVISLIG